MVTVAMGGAVPSCGTVHSDDTADEQPQLSMTDVAYNWLTRLLPAPYGHIVEFD